MYFTDDSLLPENQAPLMITAAPYGPMWLPGDCTPEQKLPVTWDEQTQIAVDCYNAGATLLHIHVHHFQPNGISGVAVLAESHISIHTWPEVGYAAMDVFMCGNANPDACVPVLREAFSPKRVAVSEILRGQGA